MRVFVFFSGSLWSSDSYDRGVMNSRAGDSFLSDSSATSGKDGTGLDGSLSSLLLELDTFTSESVGVYSCSLSSLSSADEDVIEASSASIRLVKSEIRFNLSESSRLCWTKFSSYRPLRSFKIWSYSFVMVSIFVEFAS